MIVPPATGGLAAGVLAPAILAQHSAGAVGPTVTVAPELAEPPMAIPLPSGPGTLARRKMRVNAGAADATTSDSESALIRSIRACSMMASVSPVWTVYV